MGRALQTSGNLACPRTGCWPGSERLYAVRPFWKPEGGQESQDRRPRMPETELRYRIAWALGCSESENLPPATEEWLSVRPCPFLASFHSESAPPIPEQSCLAYARYLCSHYGEHDGVLNADALVEVQELAADMSVEDVQEAILKTAEAVGSILCLHFNEPRN